MSKIQSHLNDTGCSEERWDRIFEPKRIWYDGRGKKMKPGTYNQNEVSFGKSDCVHDCEKKITEVFFFAGGYYHKMRKCKKCGGMVSVDMIDHPKGRHEFVIPKKDGFLGCRHCDLQCHPFLVIKI